VSDVDIGVDPVLHLADAGWINVGEWLEYTARLLRTGPVLPLADSRRRKGLDSKALDVCVPQGHWIAGRPRT
jgi:hypothetical protein